jgi:hypothetical protein
LAKALKTGAIEMRIGVAPLDGKRATLFRFYRMDHTAIVFIEKDAAGSAGMIAKDENLAAGREPICRETRANLGGRKLQIAANLFDLGVADSDEPNDQTTAATAQALKLIQVLDREFHRASPMSGQEL